MISNRLPLLLLLAPGTLHAQLAGFDGSIAEADLLYLGGQPRQAFEVLEARLAVDSVDYDALWRAVRAAVVVGIDEEGSRVQNAWLDPAMALGERAVATRPEGLDGLYWRGVAYGRRAMNASPGYAAELAQRAYDDAHAILRADSLHAGAHNMLGKLNYEVMSVSRIKRAIGRMFMGNEALSDMSWENAEYHLANAVEAAPEVVLFQFDLAQLHRKRGRRDEAIEAYRRVVDLPIVHPTDVSLKTQARDVLIDWDASLDPPPPDTPGDTLTDTLTETSSAPIGATSVAGSSRAP